MRPCRTSKWRPLLVLALLFLQSACASKIPSTLPLAQSEKPFVLSQLRKFQDRQCNQSLDADVTLEWQMYGKTEKIPGILQLQFPAFLRYAVVDPLGRQLFILVSDGTRFTLVDNRKASALTGQVDSAFLRKYVPSCITPKEYMPWLTGRLSSESFKVQEVRQDKESDEAVWLVTGWKNGIRHHVLFYPEGGRVARHIIEGENGEVSLEVTYLDYSSTGLECPKPRLLQVEGAEISGNVKVHFDEILPERPIPRSIFHLTLPDHFTVNTVE